MAAFNPSDLPEVTPHGEIRFASLDLLRAMAPHLSKGMLAVRGTLAAGTVGVFRLGVEGTPIAVELHVQVAGSRDGMSALTFSPVPLELTQLLQDPDVPDTSWVPARLEEPGVLALLFRAAERNASGNLLVQDGERAKAVVLAKGRVVDIRTADPAERQQEAAARQSIPPDGDGRLRTTLATLALGRLSELCAWREGTVQFLPAPVDPASGPLDHAVLPLARSLAVPSRGFPSERVLDWLQPERTLAVVASRPPAVVLTPMEEHVRKTAAAQPGIPVSKLVAGLAMEGMVPDAVVQALLLLVQLHFLVPQDAPPPAPEPAPAPEESAQAVRRVTRTAAAVPAPAAAKVAAAVDRAESIFGTIPPLRPVQGDAAPAPAAPPPPSPRPAPPTVDFEKLEPLLARLQPAALTEHFKPGMRVTPARLAQRFAELQEEAQLQLRGHPEHSPARQAVQELLDALEHRATDPVESAVIVRAYTMGLDFTDPAVHAALAAECLAKFIEEGLAKGQWKEMLPFIQREVALRPKDPLVVAHAGLADVVSQTTEAARNRTAALLVERSSQPPKSIELRVAAIRASLAVGQLRMAKRTLEAALLADPKDSRLLALQKEVERAKEGPTTGGVTAAGSSASSATKQDSAGLPDAELGTGLKLLAVVVAVLGTLGGLAVGLGLGDHEFLFDGTDGFWYLRRGFLALAALGGGALILGENPLRFLGALSFKGDRFPLLVALMVGVGSGGLSNGREYTASAALVTVLVLLHVATEELFFTGLVNRTLVQLLTPRLAATAGVTIYALYHLTFFSFASATPLNLMPTVVARVALGAGIPYALLYTKTRSVLPPLVCHLAVNLTAMALAL